MEQNCHFAWSCSDMKKLLKLECLKSKWQKRLLQSRCLLKALIRGGEDTFRNKRQDIIFICNQAFPEKKQKVKYPTRKAIQCMLVFDYRILLPMRINLKGLDSLFVKDSIFVLEV